MTWRAQVAKKQEITGNKSIQRTQNLMEGRGQGRARASKVSPQYLINIGMGAELTSIESSNTYSSIQ